MRHRLVVSSLIQLLQLTRLKVAVWRKTGKIIRTAIFDTYAQSLSAVLTILGFHHFFVLRVL